MNSGENQVQALKNLLPVESQRMPLNSSSNKLWKYMWNVVYQESSLDAKCPRFYWKIAAWHPLSYSKILDSQKENRSSVPIVLYVHKYYAQWATLIREWRKSSWHPSCQLVTKGKPSKHAILRTAVWGLLG